MIRTHTKQNRPRQHPSGSFFSKPSGTKKEAPFFAVQNANTVQRIAESVEEEPLDQATLQPKPLEGPLTAITQPSVQSFAGTVQLPGPLQKGLEALSGLNLSTVRVHHNSSHPAELNALAYTKGHDIYLGHGQDKHLPHEGWHVVQQIQGRVKPTLQTRGIAVNDDASLEREADVMGKRALQPITLDTLPTSSRATRGLGRTRALTHQHQNYPRETIQRVLGPPYPFQGIITARWSATLRRTASHNGRFRANLRRNTRVTAIGNTGNWLEVQVTLDGQVETGFVSQELVGHIPAAGFSPPLSVGGREEITAFGTYNVYPNNHRRTLQPNELYESEFRRLERAWTRINDNSGGLQIHGTAGDLADMRAMIGRGMANSQTFRNLIIEITEDSANPVTIHVGRNNAYWVDEFATNRVDLTDTEFFDAAPRPGYTWASTQDELTIHWLAERRHNVVHGGGFAAAHAEPLAAGGVQEQYRADIGQMGRIVSQVLHGPAGGLHAGVYTDDSGNIMRIQRDGSGGHPVPFEIRYEPVGGGAVDTRRNNIVVSVTSTRASTETLYLKFTNAGHDVQSPVRFVSAAASLNFTTPLGDIVPTGATVDVELYREGFWSDTLLGRLTWNHPFSPATRVISSGGVDYAITSRLAMEP